jgi:hypothetical protein
MTLGRFEVLVAVTVTRRKELGEKGIHYPGFAKTWNNQEEDRIMRGISLAVVNLGRWTMGCVLVLGMIGPAGAANAPRDPFNGRQSYSGSSMDCLVANDFYAVHFTSMQQGRQKGQSSEFVNLCHEVPAVGLTFLSIDLLDRDARTTPVALRVVEEEYTANGDEPREKETLLEIPSKIYKNGTADARVEITRPGHYALIATIGEEALSEDDRLRIPFSVAVPPPTKASSWYKDFAAALAFVFFAVMTVIGYRAYRAYNPKAIPGTEPPLAWQTQRHQKST